IQNQPEVQQVPDLSKMGNEVIKLFKYLCKKKIETCKTVRKNSANFSHIFKINRKLDWDTLSGVVVDNVPYKTSTNTVKVQVVFGTASKKSLPILVIIDDYNNFMDGVDIADQL
ncbi:20107_t:CDS:2, partial [Rhizophagus irregularis]